MTWTIETSTPPGTMTPVGPYSHISKAGPLITIRIADPAVLAETP